VCMCVTLTYIQTIQNY